MASTPSQTLPGTRPRRTGKLKKISLVPFVAVLYAYCAGGPFDYEAMVSTSGPGMTLLFILIVPWLFSVPMALASAEMATAMPVEGGFYRWTRAAFGDFSNAAGGTGLGHFSCGHRMGWCCRIM